MEPAAPGTEDEVKPFHQYNKQENEKERLLSIKARLSNGEYGNVFEFSYQNGCESWYCNLCNCPVMGKVYHHEIGKRHTSNMQAAGIQLPISRESENVSDFAQNPTIHIAPGEPVPPGFEGEALKVTLIQERLDNYKVGPLIGLEYLLEIHEYDREKEPSYLCILCDKRGDPRTVIAHLASYNHLSQYLQRHYVSTYRILSPYMTKQFKPNWQAAMQKIAEAIESKYGRLKPHYVERESFDQKRHEYQQMIARGPHFNDKNGCTFEELLDKDELTKPMAEEPIKVMKPSEETLKRQYRKTGTVPGANEKRSPPKKVAKEGNDNKLDVTKRRTSLSSVSSISSSDLSEFEPFPRKVADKRETVSPTKKPSYRLRSRSPDVRNLNRRLRSRSPDRRRRSRSNEKRYKKRRSISPVKSKKDIYNVKLPWKRSDYARNKAADVSTENRDKNKQEKLEQYKKLAAAIESDMENVKKQHEKNPEKHPQYNEEWKKFWNKRYKELQAEGKDANNYDFKPEWIQFWNKRMLELHSVEVKAKKDALRKRLGLPEEPAPVCFKITGKKKVAGVVVQDEKSSTKPAPLASVPDQDPDVIVIDDKDDDTLSSSKRSRSPWEVEVAGRKLEERRRARSRSRERNWPKNRSRDRSSSNRSQEKDRRDRDKHSRDKSSERDRSWEREKSYERGRGEYRIWSDRYGSPDSKRFNRERSYDRDMYYRDQYKKSSYLPSYLKPPRVMRDVTRHPVMSPPPVTDIVPEPELEDIEVNLVGVLRLLTALEEKLGSLGPKVIDLLAKALAMEKSEANSSETLLDNEINCVLFETVKEKLKGQLLAGLVDEKQEKAFKNAVKKAAELIHVAEERRRTQSRKKEIAEPVTVPGIGTIDKAAIAKQIATALVMQGKTDVTQQELEQLINAVVGMAEASKNSNKPINTATFLQQLTSSQKTTTITPESISLFSDGKTKLTNSPKEMGMSGSNMDGLSDSDLQTLLQNFKDLSTEEQHGLISYLKKLEAKEPERVERLRKFVKLDNSSAEEEVMNKDVEKGSKKEKTESQGTRASSPFSKRLGSGNPMPGENRFDEEGGEDNERDEEKKYDKKETIKTATTKINLDSEDEEEYSYEDVFKAASKNISEREKKETGEQNLTDAKALIANLMGQLGARNSAPREVPVSVHPASSSSSSSVANFSAANLTRTLSNLPISMANLASIVSNANRNSTSSISTSTINSNLTENLPIMSKSMQGGNPTSSGNYISGYNNNYLSEQSMYSNVPKIRPFMEGSHLGGGGGGNGGNNMTQMARNPSMIGSNYGGGGYNAHMNQNGPGYGSGGGPTSMGGGSGGGMDMSRSSNDYGNIQYPIKSNLYGNQNQYPRQGNFSGNGPRAPLGGNLQGNEQNRMGNSGGYSMQNNRMPYTRPTYYGGRW